MITNKINWNSILLEFVAFIVCLYSLEALFESDKWVFLIPAAIALIIRDLVRDKRSKQEGFELAAYAFNVTIEDCDKAIERLNKEERNSE